MTRDQATQLIFTVSGSFQVLIWYCEPLLPQQQRWCKLPDAWVFYFASWIRSLEVQSVINPPNAYTTQQRCVMREKIQHEVWKHGILKLDRRPTSSCARCCEPSPGGPVWLFVLWPQDCHQDLLPESAVESVTTCRVMNHNVSTALTLHGPLFHWRRQDSCAKVIVQADNFTC